MHRSIVWKLCRKIVPAKVVLRKMVLVAIPTGEKAPFSIKGSFFFNYFSSFCTTRESQPVVWCHNAQIGEDQCEYSPSGKTDSSEEAGDRSQDGAANQTKSFSEPASFSS